MRTKKNRYTFIMLLVCYRCLIDFVVKYCLDVMYNYFQPCGRTIDIMPSCFASICTMSSDLIQNVSCNYIFAVSISTPMHSYITSSTNCLSIILVSRCRRYIFCIFSVSSKDKFISYLISLFGEFSFFSLIIDWYHITSSLNRKKLHHLLQHTIN